MPEFFRGYSRPNPETRNPESNSEAGPSFCTCRGLIRSLGTRPLNEFQALFVCTSRRFFFVFGISRFVAAGLRFCLPCPAMSNSSSLPHPHRMSPCGVDSASASSSAFVVVFVSLGTHKSFLSLPHLPRVSHLAVWSGLSSLCFVWVGTPALLWISTRR